MPRSLICLGLLALLTASIATEARAAAIKTDLCSRRTGKKITVTVLKSSADFYDVLSEDGERIVLQASGYEQCKGSPQDAAAPPPPPVPVEPAVTPPQPQTLDTLRITGSSTVGQGVLPYLISGYAGKISAQVSELSSDDPLRKIYELRKTAKDAPFLRIAVKSTGSATALPDLVDKLADAGISSRPYTDQEIEKLVEIRGMGARGDVEHVIALDGVLFFVNRDNPATVMNFCDVAKVFGGKIKNWSELVPGFSAPADIHTGDSRSGTFEIVAENLLDACGETLSRNHTPHNSQAEIISSVAGKPGGIGYAAKALAASTVRALRLKGRCGIETEPTAFNIKSEDYPLSRRLYLFTPHAYGENARAFLDYVLASDAAQTALKGAEATDQFIEQAAGPDNRLEQGRGLAENQDPLANQFSGNTAHTKRLSISYRFAANNATLDTKAEQDILRLVTYFRTNRFAGSILLAGFADSDGSRAANVALSQGRAEAVKQAIAKLDPAFASSIAARGYGSVLPVACNDTELGKAKNRRVEVWLMER
jgi:phosphate transport system substrate-binding protein